MTQPTGPLDEILATAQSRLAALRAPLRGPVYGAHGAVATGHPLATLAALDVLRSGGNAFDAALSAASVMVVVAPYASHLGGDAFALVRTAQGETLALNAGGRAPQRASIDAFPQGIPERGPRAVAIPGFVDAWCALHARFATKSRAELLAPAIALARDGFPVSQHLAFTTRTAQETLASDPGCAATFLADGPPRPGALLRQPDLASTLEAIAAEGRDGFYRGWVGGRILTLMRERDGLLTEADFAQDQAVWGGPLTVAYRDATVHGQPPPTQGIIALQALRILDGLPRPDSPLSEEAVFAAVEAVRLAFADRYAHLGDPDVVDLPVGRLLSEAYAAELRARIGERALALPSVPVRDGDTTSFAVIDAAGNAVSFIQSVFSTWGAAVLVPGTGVLLNNRLTAFSLDSTSPNALVPGKRTVHTLNTWLLERGDGTFFAGGTPGANFQVQTNLQVVRGLVDWRLDPQLAIDAPRWGFIQGELLMESRFPVKTMEGLRRRGYAVRPIAAWEVQLSRSQLVGRLPGRGALFAASDLRSEGLALAF